AVAALTVFAFLAAWNQYLWPLLITKDDKLRTVQIGLKQLQQSSIGQLNIVFAGAVIAVVPLVILLLFFQKQLVRGLTAGAVKGGRSRQEEFRSDLAGGAAGDGLRRGRHTGGGCGQQHVVPAQRVEVGVEAGGD